LKNLQTESERLDLRVPFLVRWLFLHLYLSEERSARFLSRRERFNLGIGRRFQSDKVFRESERIRRAIFAGIELKKRKHVGSSIDQLLAEDGTLAEAEAAALKRVIAWQVERGMGERRMSKSDMARAMRTSRAALDRLLDPKNESVTLRTMARAASALGKRLRLELA
jgi:DNA-binding Xre family transcriptional regulator